MTIAILLLLQYLYYYRLLLQWIPLSIEFSFFFVFRNSAFLYKNQVCSHKFTAEKHYFMTVVSQSAHKTKKYREILYEIFISKCTCIPIILLAKK